MARSDDHRLARERCLTNAERAPNADLGRSWLAAAESYDLLSKLDRYIYDGALIDPPHLFTRRPE